MPRQAEAKKKKLSLLTSLTPSRLTLSYPKLSGDVQPYLETARKLT